MNTTIYLICSKWNVTMFTRASVHIMSSCTSASLSFSFFIGRLEGGCGEPPMNKG